MGTEPQLHTGSSNEYPVILNIEDIFLFPSDFCSLTGEIIFLIRPAMNKLITSHVEAPLSNSTDLKIISLI